MLLASEDIKQKQNERKEINPKIDADYLKKKKRKKKKRKKEKRKKKKDFNALLHAHGYLSKTLIY